MELNEYLVKSIKEIPEQNASFDKDSTVAFTGIVDEGTRWQSRKLCVRGDYFTKVAKYLMNESSYSGSWYKSIKDDANKAQREITGKRTTSFVYIEFTYNNLPPNIGAWNPLNIGVEYDRLINKRYQMRTFTKQEYDFEVIKEFINMKN